MADNELEEGDEDEIISEAAEYSPKSEFSKPKLVYTASEKCVNSRGKEMKAGYYNIQMSKEGIPLKKWIEDSRQVFIGCVSSLKTILSPELKLNKEYKELVESYLKRKEKIKEKYIYKEKIKKNEKGIVVYSETGINYIPEIGEKVIIQDIYNPESGTEVNGGWDSYVNLYWNECVEIYDLIFEALNDLINKLNYFKQGISF